MARYKKYRYGGKRVPGMYKAEKGDEIGTMMGTNTNNQSRPTPPTDPQIQSNTKTTNMMEVEDDLTARNDMFEYNARMQAMQMHNMQKMMMELKMQNMLLQQQNELQNTQIQKMDLINSARTTKKPVGSMNSPKRKGGIVKAKRGKRIEIISTGNSMMRKGGGLPGGRFSKRR